MSSRPPWRRPFKLDVTETRYRGHATKLASAARSQGYGLVLTLGGDGTVNEAVNGILARRRRTAGQHPRDSARPCAAAARRQRERVHRGARLAAGSRRRHRADPARVAEHRERTIGLGKRGRPVLHVQRRARARRRGRPRRPGPAGARRASARPRSTSGWRCGSSTGRPTGGNPSLMIERDRSASRTGPSFSDRLQHRPVDLSRQARGERQSAGTASTPGSTCSHCAKCQRSAPSLPFARC